MHSILFFLFFSNLSLKTTTLWHKSIPVMPPLFFITWTENTHKYKNCHWPHVSTSELKMKATSHAVQNQLSKNKHKPLQQKTKQNKKMFTPFFCNPVKKQFLLYYPENKMHWNRMLYENMLHLFACINWKTFHKTNSWSKIYFIIMQCPSTCEKFSSTQLLN